MIISYLVLSYIVVFLLILRYGPKVLGQPLDPGLKPGLLIIFLMSPLTIPIALIFLAWSYVMDWCWREK